MHPSIPPSSSVAIIPARGGSKRIPGKNIKSFCGRPIIAWSIAAAKDSGLFDRVVVSTDCDAIAQVAREHGAEVPFVRPNDIANDTAGIRDVVTHCIMELGDELTEVRYVCCLMATAPFIQVSDLARGLKDLVEQDADFAYTVTKYSYPIQRALKRREDGRVELLFPEHRQKRSQDLEEAYHDAGQFYWGKVSSFPNRSLWIPSPISVPVIVPTYRAQDIDTPEDWVRAEWMFRANQESSTNL